jgi:DNA-binding MarR family transcriptional regulator
VVDAVDPRRLNVVLTEHGKAAVMAIRDAFDRVDEVLREQVGADYIANTRTTLGVLAELRERTESDL